MGVAQQIIFGQIEDERRRQDQKWGPQSWPDGTGEDNTVTSFPKTPTNKTIMEDTKLTLALGMNRADRKDVTWWNIFKEEAFEAGCEKEWTALRAEIIQAAAVLVAWIEDGDQRFFKMLEA